jgi:hypothetical protein
MCVSGCLFALEPMASIGTLEILKGFHESLKDRVGGMEYEGHSLRHIKMLSAFCTDSNLF